MALTKNQQAIQDIYGTHLGRQAGSEGLDYWAGQLDSGAANIDDIIRGIQSGSEYQERKKFLEANPTATEADLDARISPGGGIFTDPDKPFMAPVFAADNTWSAPLMTSGNNTYTDELEQVYKDLKIGGASDTGSPHYNTAAAENTGTYEVGKTHDEVGNVLTTSGSDNTNPDTTNPDTTNPGTTNQGTTKTTEQNMLDLNTIFNNVLGRDVGNEGSTYWNDEYNRMIGSGMDHATAQQNIVNSIKSGKEHSGRQGIVDYFNNRYGMNPSESFLDAYIGPGGVSLRDLPTGSTTAATTTTPTTNDGWWNQFEDANAFKSFLSEGQEPQESEFDQFTKFLTAIQGLGGMGGGMGNYGYGGYGGFTPGGVAAASPTSNMMNFMNAFRNMRGTSSPAVTTGNIGF